MKTTAGKMVDDIQKEIKERLERVKFMYEHGTDPSYICTKYEKEAIKFLRADYKYYSKMPKDREVILGKIE